jgi:hypothetical protein
MRTQRVAAAAVALALIHGGAVRAQGPPVPIRTEIPGGVAVDIRGGEAGPIEIEALPDGRIGVRMKKGAGQDESTMIVEPLPGKRLRIVGRDAHTLECSHLTLVIQHDEATRKVTDQQDRLDRLDESRASCELLKIEVEALRTQLQKMSAVLKESELVEIQGFSGGQTLGGDSSDERKARLQSYKEKIDGVREDFLIKSKALSREQRRLARLETERLLTTASATPQPGGLRRDDADRLLDSILKGVETWQRASSPTPPPPSSDTRTSDTDRLLDLVRKGLETWQGSPSPKPDDAQSKDVDRILDLIRKGVETWQGPTPPPASPAPSPAEPASKDSDRILELILRGLETWQRR